MRIFYESNCFTEPLLYLPSHPQEKLKFICMFYNGKGLTSFQIILLNDNLGTSIHNFFYYSCPF